MGSLTRDERPPDGCGVGEVGGNVTILLPDRVLGRRATVREPLPLLNVAEQGAAGFLPGPARP